KPASETPLAFDQPNGQNNLFGYGDGKGAHFDKILADILKEQNSEFAAEFAAAFEKTDSVGYTVEQRVNMYTPLYYLMETRDGFGKSNVAKYWRIRSGIEQFNTSVTTEANLALALEKYDGVKSVDFETVWAQGHTEAERTGDATANFIAWINSCVKG
ncbi:MAG: tannase, partial [Ruminococcus sp.]|nr:tannase [Ruminococcus sp.]